MKIAHTSTSIIFTNHCLNFSKFGDIWIGTNGLQKVTILLTVCPTIFNIVCAAIGVDEYCGWHFRQSGNILCPEIPSIRAYLDTRIRRVIWLAHSIRLWSNYESSENSIKAWTVSMRKGNYVNRGTCVIRNIAIGNFEYLVYRRTNLF